MNLPLPKLMSADETQATALQMAGHLLWMERASEGALKICRSTTDLRACLEDGTIAAIMHMEGAEAIGPELDALYAFPRHGAALARPGVEPADRVRPRACRSASRAIPTPARA